MGRKLCRSLPDGKERRYLVAWSGFKDMMICVRIIISCTSHWPIFQFLNQIYKPVLSLRLKYPATPNQPPSAINLIYKHRYLFWYICIRAFRVRVKARRAGGLGWYGWRRIGRCLSCRGRGGFQRQELMSDEWWCIRGEEDLINFLVRL